MHVKTLTLAPFILLGLLAAGCDNKPANTAAPTGADAPTATADDGLPDAIFLAEAPAGARPVGDVKADPDATGEVVIHGRIGGRAKPFVDNAAVFVIADAKLKDCIQLHGKGGCPTPWDYCCEPKDSLLANTATVRIVGEDGQPLRIAAKGEHGLEPLVGVTVVGAIAPRDSTDVLVIDARQVYVEPKEAPAAQR